jgi:hypothetical protein
MSNNHAGAVNPHPIPLPEYQEREKSARRPINRINPAPPKVSHTPVHFTFYAFQKPAAFRRFRLIFLAICMQRYR